MIQFMGNSAVHPRAFAPAQYRELPQKLTAQGHIAAIGPPFRAVNIALWATE